MGSSGTFRPRLLNKATAMSAKTNCNVKYPFEYISAQVEFGSKIVAVKKGDPIKIFNEYTSIYGTLTNHMFADNKKNAWIKDVVKKLDFYILKYKNPTTLSKKIYELYLTIPLEKIHTTVTDKLCFGCFRLNYSEYYRKRKEVRLHFAPIRKGLIQKHPDLRASDLAPVYLSERVSEFSEMINHIYKNKKEFKGVTHFVSSSWLQNISTYRSFFPESKKISKVKVEGGYWWIWGQFLKWDLSGNTERLAGFKKSLKNAKSLKTAVNAIPFPIYEIKVPIELMFEKYVTNYKSHK